MHVVIHVILLEEITTPHFHQDELVHNHCTSVVIDSISRQKFRKGKQLNIFAMTTVFSNSSKVISR